MELEALLFFILFIDPGSISKAKKNKFPVYNSGAE